jgi:acetyl esterase/lipase
MARRSPLVVACVLILVSAGVGRAAGDAEIVLWPESVPGPQVPAEPAEQVTKSTKDGISRRSNVSKPRLVVYDGPRDASRPDGGKPRSAVIVVPGGGFGILADEHEGSDVCRWFSERGIVAFLLLHRVPTNRHAEPNEGPVLDAQQAVKLVRGKAADLGVDPRKIALLGFSAGGQVAAVAATKAPPEKPDCVLLVYPWRIVGDKNEGLRPDLVIDATAPPMFIAQAANDPGSVPQGSLNLFTALLAAKVPAELHLYEAGGHGFGMQRRDNAPGTSDWPNRAVDWLRTRGW